MFQILKAAVLPATEAKSAASQPSLKGVQWLCRFSRISLLLEPGLVIMAFAVAIAAILGFSRLDLSLGESKGSKGGQGGGPEIPHASPKEVFDQICTILTGELQPLALELPHMCRHVWTV